MIDATFFCSGSRVRCYHSYWKLPNGFRPIWIQPSCQCLFTSWTVAQVLIDGASHSLVLHQSHYVIWWAKNRHANQGTLQIRPLLMPALIAQFINTISSPLRALASSAELRDPKDVNSSEAEHPALPRWASHKLGDLKRGKWTWFGWVGTGACGWLGVPLFIFKHTGGGNNFIQCVIESNATAKSVGWCLTPGWSVHLWCMTHEKQMQSNFRGFQIRESNVVRSFIKELVNWALKLCALLR